MIDPLLVEATGAKFPPAASSPSKTISGIISGVTPSNDIDAAYGKLAYSGLG